MLCPGTLWTVVLKEHSALIVRVKQFTTLCSVTSDRLGSEVFDSGARDTDTYRVFEND